MSKIEMTGQKKLVLITAERTPSSPSKLPLNSALNSFPLMPEPSRTVSSTPASTRVSAARMRS